MSSEGLGEMFEGDSADMCAGKFSPTSMGGRAEGLAFADPGARTPIGARENFICVMSQNILTATVPDNCQTTDKILNYDEQNQLMKSNVASTTPTCSLRMEAVGTVRRKECSVLWSYSVREHVRTESVICEGFRFYCQSSEFRVTCSAKKILFSSLLFGQQLSRRIEFLFKTQDHKI